MSNDPCSNEPLSLTHGLVKMGADISWIKDIFSKISVSLGEYCCWMSCLDAMVSGLWISSEKGS